MSRRSMFPASSFIAATLAAFIFLSLRYPAAAIFGACAALIGAICAWLLPPQTAYHQHEEQAAATLSSKTIGPSLAKDYEPFNTAALLDAMLNSMRKGVLMVDEEFAVLSPNRAARDIFKSLNGGAASKRLSEVTRNLSVHEAFGAALKEGTRVEVKVETGPGAERRSYDLRVAPLSAMSARTERRTRHGRRNTV